MRALKLTQRRPANEAITLLQASAALEKGSKFNVSALVPGRNLLERPHLQNRLVDLLHPYVCSMEHVDIVHGHSGTGKSTELKRACTDVPSGTLYIDLESHSNVGARILQALTGDLNRGLFQRFRDLLWGRCWLWLLRPLHQAMSV